MMGSESLQSVPNRPLYEAMKAKLNLHQKSQDVGENRTVGLRKAVGMEWSYLK